MSSRITLREVRNRLAEHHRREVERIAASLPRPALPPRDVATS
jgi:hypothetical protein